MRINQTIESIQESELVVIGGRPGSGKSAFANLLVQDIF
jgi:replicative DNA helicase